MADKGEKTKTGSETAEKVMHPKRIEALAGLIEAMISDARTEGSDVFIVSSEHKISLTDAEVIVAALKSYAGTRHIDIVFSQQPGGVPTHEFIEIEDDGGKSISLGTWLRREVRDDNYDVLRITEQQFREIFK